MFPYGKLTLFLILAFCQCAPQLKSQETLRANKHPTFIQVLSRTKSICEESAKHIKDNWKENSKAFHEARKLYNLVKAESDSWICEIELLLLLEQLTDLNAVNFERIVFSQKNFLSFYQKYSTDKQILIRHYPPNTEAVVGSINTPHSNKLRFISSEAITPTLNPNNPLPSAALNRINCDLGQLSNEQRNHLIKLIQQMKLKSWNELSIHPTSMLPPHTETDFKEQHSHIKPDTATANKPLPPSFQSATEEKAISPIPPPPKHLDLANELNLKLTETPSKNAVSFAVVTALEYHLRKHNPSFPKNTYLSPDYIYHYTHTTESNVYLADALFFIKEKGAATTDDWKQNLTSSSDTQKKLKTYTIANYELLYNKYQKPSKSLEKIICSGLDTYGPLVTEIKLFENNFSKKNKAIIKDSNASNHQYLHTVILVGYDEKARLFKFLNDKGKNWGDNGFGYFSYEYAQKHLKYLYGLIYHPS